MHGTYIVLSGGLAVLFFVVGCLKIGKQQKMLASARHLGYSVRAFQAIGGAEVAAGCGLVLGRFWTPAGVAAAIGLVALLIGAVISVRRAGDSPREMAPAVWIGILAAVTAVAGVASA